MRVYSWEFYLKKKNQRIDKRDNSIFYVLMLIALTEMNLSVYTHTSPYTHLPTPKIAFYLTKLIEKKTKQNRSSETRRQNSILFD